jgi:hypothetical protein
VLREHPGTAGVMYYYQSASDNNKTQNTVSELMSIVSAVNGLYAGQQNYKGLNGAVLYNTSAVPENYKGAGNKITHPFGDEVNIGPVNNGDDGYYVLLKQIPKAACVNLATMNFGTSMAGVGVGDIETAISGQKASQTPPAGATATANRNTMYTGAFTPKQASDVCTGDYNNIGYQLK